MLKQATKKQKRHSEMEDPVPQSGSLHDVGLRYLSGLAHLWIEASIPGS